MRKAILTLLMALSAVFSVAAHADPILHPFEPDSLARIIEKQKGKPFVLLVWSLDCEFCQTSLKTLSQEIHKRKGLDVVMLSTDMVDDSQAATLMQNRLTSLGLAGNAWAFGSAPPEQLRYAIDPKWRGEMPRSYWFNARGEKVAYSGVLTVAMIDQLLSHR